MFDSFRKKMKEKGRRKRCVAAEKIKWELGHLSELTNSRVNQLAERGHDKAIKEYGIRLAKQNTKGYKPPKDQKDNSKMSKAIGFCNAFKGIGLGGFSTPSRYGVKNGKSSKGND